MASSRFLRLFVLASSLTSLAACGGAGGSSPKPPALLVRFERLTSAAGDAAPMSISADGSVVGGDARSGTTAAPVLWRGTAQGDAVPDAGTPSLDSLTALSGDGTSWIDEGILRGKSVPILGSALGQKRVLPLLPGASAGTAVDLSADGAVALCVAPDNFSSPPPGRPYLVAGDVLTALPMPPEGALGTTNAAAISADGRVAVGRAAGRVARWEGGELRTLSTREGGANDVSQDGSAVVGWLIDGQGENVPFRWTESTGIQELPTVPGARYAIAVAVSADGRTVLINAFDVAQDRERTFLWREGAGTRALEDVVRELEPRVAFDGAQAAAMSADGKVLVGGGWTGIKGATLPAWRLVLP